MELNSKLTTFFKEEIYKWVANNFGEQEAEDPSWSIEDLSSHLATKLLRKVHKDTNMVHYELTLALHAGLDVNETLTKVEQKLKDLEGEILEKEHEGLKTLSYEIRGMKRADMSHWQVLILKENIAEFTGYLNSLHDEVLRWLFVRVEERKK
jgi:ribosomal protein S6